MVAMKVVVNRNRNTRTVINAVDLEQRMIVVDSHSQHRSFVVADVASTQRINRNNSVRKLSTRQRKKSRNEYNASRKYPQTIKERDARYLIMKKHIRRDLAITREKFARLSVNISTDNSERPDEKIKNSVEPSAIQLREPVLQFSRSYGEASSSGISAASSVTTEKGDSSNGSLIEIFKCRMCPNYALPEAYECAEGHLVCDECYLISSHCTLCPSKSLGESTRCNDFRRVHSMEKISSLLMFPCRWRERGCLEYVGPGDWRNHVELCRHAEVQVNPLTFASQVSSISDLSDYGIDSEDNVVDP